MGMSSLTEGILPESRPGEERAQCALEGYDYLVGVDRPQICSSAFLNQENYEACYR